MKKLYAVLLALVLVTVSITTVFAASDPTFTMGKARFSSAGDTAVMKIEAKNLESIAVIQFTLTYDSTKIELQNIADGSDDTIANRVLGAAENGIISDAVVSCVEPGKINVVWEGIKEKVVSGDGILVEFEFKALVDNVGIMKLELVTEGYDAPLIKQDANNGLDYITVDITVEEEPDPVKPGDVNIDGAVDVIDLQRLYSHLNGSNPILEENLVFADVNNDSEVDVIDLQRLYSHLNGSNPLFK